VPVYKNMKLAMMKHPDADVMISFASLRSAEESTIEAMQYKQIRSIAIIAEGMKLIQFFTEILFESKIAFRIILPQEVTVAVCLLL